MTQDFILAHTKKKRETKILACKQGLPKVHKIDRIISNVYSQTFYYESS